MQPGITSLMCKSCPLCFSSGWGTSEQKTHITCCSIHPWVIVQSPQQWQGTTLHKLYTAEESKQHRAFTATSHMAARQRTKMAWYLRACGWSAVDHKHLKYMLFKNIQWVLCLWRLWNHTWLSGGELSGRIKSCHALNDGPQNSKTHCSGLVVLSCLARHGRGKAAAGQRTRGKREKGETTVPECLHIAYAHSLCASLTTQATGIPRSVRIWSVHFC